MKGRQVANPLVLNVKLIRLEIEVVTFNMDMLENTFDLAGQRFTHHMRTAYRSVFGPQILNPRDAS